MPPHITRRKFLTVTAGTLVAGSLGGYSYWESQSLEVHPVTVRLKGLPSGFDGCRIAFLADLHHGWFISREYISRSISMANDLHPDLIFLGGDYVQSDPSYIAPVMEELGRLKAPLGVFAVQGNRDIRVNRVLTSKELARQGIRELTNKGVWIHRNGDKIWLCGMDDSTIGSPNVVAAMDGLSHDAVSLVMTHNPDFVEALNDPRLLLVCCVHTHGGQINLPFVGRPFINSINGQKYAQGLVKAPHTMAFTTTGVGACFPPLRFRCPPELALLTLAA